MSAPMIKQSPENDSQVTYEDQQKINKFARNNARLQDLKDELKNKQKEMQDLQDAEDELMMQEDGSLVPFQIGEVFVSLNSDETTNMIESTKNNTQQDIAKIEKQCEVHQQILQDLKVELYAKFGTNINLEAEDDS